MKVHLTLCYGRALCGLNPLRGKYDIRTAATFFQCADSDQCSSCLHHFAHQGHSIKRARESASLSMLPRAQVVADRACAL